MTIYTNACAYNGQAFSGELEDFLGRSQNQDKSKEEGQPKNRVTFFRRQARQKGGYHGST